MSECTHDCSSCSQNCSERKPESFLEAPHKLSKIKKVIAVVSGKGGVGKSTVTTQLACHTQAKGLKTAILDADITGPSIPKMLGITDKAYGTEDGLLPVKSNTGIDVMSVNLLLDDETAPVVWRGPVIGGTVKQFWTDVIWENEDIMFIDMPPGTGDVPLTVFQSIPVDGIVIVTSPQQLVSMIVKKAANMAKMMNIPIIGIVENMSYFQCPDCNGIHHIFGESNIDALAKDMDIDTVSKIPFNKKLAAACDKGMIELFEGDWLDNMADKVERTAPVEK